MLVTKDNVRNSNISSGEKDINIQRIKQGEKLLS